MDETILCELLHPKNENEDLKIDFSVAHAILKVGESSLKHQLNSSVEIYYILDGKGIISINNEKEEVNAGQLIYIPANSKQYLKNNGNTELKFLCIVYPMWREADEKLIKKGEY